MGNFNRSQYGEWKIGFESGSLFKELIKRFAYKRKTVASSEATVLNSKN